MIYCCIYGVKQTRGKPLGVLWRNRKSPPLPSIAQTSTFTTNSSWFVLLCLERNIAPSFPRNLFACQYVSTLLTQWPGHRVNCCQTLSASWQILLSCLSWARSIFFVSSCYIPSKFSSTKLVTVIFKVSPPHPPPPLSQSRLINRVISELIIVMLFWTLWNTSHSRLCWSSFQC